MTVSLSDIDFPGFKGIVSLSGTDRLGVGELKDSRNVYNVGGDLVRRPGFQRSTNITGVSSAPITLIYYRSPRRFYVQGSSESGAIDADTTITVAGTNANPGYDTGTGGGGSLPGGLGGVAKHDHSQDTYAKGGYLGPDTKLSDDPLAPTIARPFSDLMTLQDLDAKNGNYIVVQDDAIIESTVSPAPGAYNRTVLQLKVVKITEAGGITNGGNGDAIEFYPGGGGVEYGSDFTVNNHLGCFVGAGLICLAVKSYYETQWELASVMGVA